MPSHSRLFSGIGRHLDVWRSAWREQKRQGPTRSATGKELEFLPAVLELQETPPSPVGRAIGLVMILVFATGIAWASLGQIDIVAVAQGKIIPTGNIKVIQPLETGVIKAILVKDGQAVSTGDTLIALDTTASGADQERLTQEYRTALVEAARLRALIAGKSALKAPKDAPPQTLALQRQMLRDQLAEYHARLASAASLINQRAAAIEETQAQIESLETTLPMLQERSRAFEQLLEKKYVSRLQYLQLEEDRINKQQQLAALKQQLAQDRAALTEAKQNHQAIQSEFKKTHQAELAVIETKAASLSQELIKAKTRTRLQKLAAPVDGVVQQLAVHTIGGVVTPAQQLMVIVPKEERIEVEAWVENRDIGFVNPGQTAEIKVEAFPFTRYGTIEGTITSLSKDAVPIEKVGLVYAARVAMGKTTIEVENKTVNLSPGMNVSVEIKTGQRRLIEFFLSPLLRGAKESLRER